MKLSNPLPLLFVAACMTLGATAQATPVDLRYHLQDGESYGLTVTLDQEITQSPMGQEKQEVKQHFAIGYRLDVLKTDPAGNTTVKTTYERLAMKNETPMGSMGLDTDSPAEEIAPPLKLFAASKGMSFEMTFTPEGKITDVKGVDTLLGNLCAQAEGMEPQMKTMVCKQLESQFGETAIVESMEQGMAIFPSKPVSVGDAWEQTFEVTNACPMTLKRQLTLKKVEGNIAEIAVAITITKPRDLKPIDAGPLQMKCELEGNGTGTWVVDTTTGWMKSGTTTINVSGTMTALPNDFIPEETSWPISLTSTTTLEAKKL